MAGRRLISLLGVDSGQLLSDDNFFSRFHFIALLFGSELRVKCTPQILRGVSFQEIWNQSSAEVFLVASICVHFEAPFLLLLLLGFSFDLHAVLLISRFFY